MPKKTRLDNLLENLLKEDVPPTPPESSQEFAPVEQKNISLDQTVDRYLVRYEREAIPTNEVYESLDHLAEQLDDAGLDDEPLEDEPPADAGGEDEGGLGDLGGDLGGGDDAGDASGGDGGAVGQASPVVATPRINLNDFARALARLVNNYEALLDPKTTLLNRAEAYIASNYDQRTAEELMQILEVNYNLAPATNENTATPDNEFPEPYTAGAWGGGGGA